jgi:hypothetical protein
MRGQRNFFAAIGDRLTTRIFEMRKDGKYRALLWSRLTTAERKRGKELVALLTRAKSFCDLKSPTFPKAAEVAKEVEGFVASVESRHGAEVWLGWSK